MSQGFPAPTSPIEERSPEIRHDRPEDTENRSQPVVGQRLASKRWWSSARSLEILQAVRETGLASLDGVEAVVLETDGAFSVVKKSTDSEINSALANVARPRRG